MADKNREVLEAYLDEGCRVVSQLAPKSLRYTRHYSIADEDGTIQNFEATFEVDNETKELRVVNCHLYNDEPLNEIAERPNLDNEIFEWGLGTAEHVIVKLIQFAKYSSVSFSNKHKKGDISSVTTVTNYRDHDKAKEAFRDIKRNFNMAKELF